MSKLQQNFNSAGVSLFIQILGIQHHHTSVPGLGSSMRSQSRPHIAEVFPSGARILHCDHRIALPHLTVPDIRSLNWVALREAGFKGVVFDKDNTLSRPYDPKIDPKLQSSVDECKRVFGGKLVLYSNSAGLTQFDPQGQPTTPPAGGSEELESHFGCPSSQLLMVGDRYLTDIVFGNRHGMMTVRPAPLVLEGEPAGVVVARRVEEFYIRRWSGRGILAPDHPLLLSNPDVKRFLVPDHAATNRFIVKRGRCPLTPSSPAEFPPQACSSVDHRNEHRKRMSIFTHRHSSATTTTTNVTTTTTNVTTTTTNVIPTTTNVITTTKVITTTTTNVIATDSTMDPRV
ncbi:MAG: hypothetical protein WDW38_010194 [Sanguina aurantia]